MAGENVAVVEAIVEAMNEGDLDRVIAQIDPDEFELDYSRSLSPDLTGVHHGHRAIRRFLEELVEPWEEFELIADKFIEVGDHVILVSHTRNHGRGSGVEVVARGAALYEFRGGRLVAWRLFQGEEEALAAVGSSEQTRPPEPSEATRRRREGE